MIIHTHTYIVQFGSKLNNKGSLPFSAAEYSVALAKSVCGGGPAAPTLILTSKVPVQYDNQTIFFLLTTSKDNISILDKMLKKLLLKLNTN